MLNNVAVGWSKTGTVCDINSLPMDLHVLCSYTSKHGVRAARHLIARHHTAVIASLSQVELPYVTLLESSQLTGVFLGPEALLGLYTCISKQLDKTP